MNNERMPDFYISPELAEVARKLAAAMGTSLAEFLRHAVRVTAQLENERSIRAVKAGPTTRTCVVCETPRLPDAVQDSIAHAQCDQIMSNLERTVSG